MREIQGDVIIVGASFGGVATALGAARTDASVIMTEKTCWIGGQATGQGVPLDEHPWIEQYGGTKSYSTFRNKVREYYRRNYPLKPKAAADPFLNPGACWVSALGFEPKVGQAVLYEMLAPYISAGKILILTGCEAVAADMEHDRCRAVRCRMLLSEEELVISGQYFLDATELGDLLELGAVEYVTGAESQQETGEPLALDGPADPLRQQPFTHLIAVSYAPGREEASIPKPASYEKYRERLSGITAYVEQDKGMTGLFAADDQSRYRQCIWNFRRHFCKNNFEQAFFDSDITVLMNGNEYRDWVLVGVSPEEKSLALAEAKELSLSLVYYLQNEVPCPDGSCGIKGLYVRPDVFNTLDGLAVFPYIRESRRIKAVFTVLEQHFRIDEHPERPVIYEDSVGLSGYRIDIHEKTRDNRPNITTAVHGQHWVQQIPLGALIPVRVQNILPACKNIGTTHVTNGSFRVHATEWNIGEAAGELASFCVRRNVMPREVRGRQPLLADYQAQLVRDGVALYWPEYTYARSYASQPRDKSWYFGEVDRL